MRKKERGVREMKITNAVKNAISIGTLCAVAYLTVYIARNILSTVSPQMISEGSLTTENIGTLSSLYFGFYAVGQLINGIIGDKIKPKYMMGFGLVLAGVCNFVFPFFIKSILVVYGAYALSGFFLSMIYGPMTKVISENVEPHLAPRCAVANAFTALFGSPAAGIVAAFFVWQNVFKITGGLLIVMALICFVCFRVFEKKGIVKYGQFSSPKGEKGSVKILFKYKIVKFTIISVVTGVVRTTVVFWLPTYLSQHLKFSEKTSALLFTVSTLVISAAAFVSVAVYELFKKDMEKTALWAFVASSVCFAMMLVANNAVLNITFMVLAILTANIAATMLWSFYCPSLRDTGMVSSATGFLDFMSYMAASVSSKIFANAVGVIGWGGLITVWCALMVVGVVISLPFKKIKKVK